MLLWTIFQQNNVRLITSKISFLLIHQSLQIPSSSSHFLQFLGFRNHLQPSSGHGGSITNDIYVDDPKPELVADDHNRCEFGLTGSVREPPRPPRPLQHGHDLQVFQKGRLLRLRVVPLVQVLLLFISFSSPSFHRYFFFWKCSIQLFD